jgi:GMP synthase-like glutamine amidotransferase
VPAALVLANRDDADPGLVGEALIARGYRLTTLAREDDGEGWPRAPSRADIDLVLILGSEWSVYGEAVQDPVQRELAFVAGAVDAGVPVLAICFGAQLLSAALGGEVAPARRTELGWLEVQPVDPGPDRRDRGGSSLITIEHGPWFQFHGDAFTVPPGATELARSDVGPQAFAAGSALGVQFHPEVTPDIVGRWAASDPEPVSRAGFTAEELVARTAVEQPRAQLATARLVDAFLAAKP